MRLLLLCALAATTGTPAADGGTAVTPPTDSELAALLGAKGRLDVEDKVWKAVGLPDPLALAAGGAPGDLGPTLQKAAQAYGVSLDVSRLLLAGALAESERYSRRNGDELARQAETWLGEALKRAPNALGPMIAYLDSGARDDRVVLAALGDDRSRGRRALELARTIQRVPGYNGTHLVMWEVPLLILAANDDPSTRRDVATAMHTVHDEDGLALGLALWRGLKTTERPGALGTTLASTLAAAGAHTLAVGVFDELSEAERRRALAPPTEPMAIMQDDARLALCDALVDAGRTKLVDACLQPVTGAHAEDWTARFRDRRTMLRYAMTPDDGKDPFDALNAFVDADATAGPLSIVPRLGKHYPAEMARALHRRFERLRRWSANEQPPFNGHRQFVVEAAAAIARDRASSQARVGALLQSLPTVTSQADTFARPAILARIAHAAESVFVERKLSSLDGGPRPVAEAARGEQGDEKLAGLPDGFWPARVERSGRAIHVIAASQAVDPTGEATRGGYWYVASSDAGKTWSRPLYTGLRDHRPYMVLEHSALPLVQHGWLRIEVKVEELAEESLTFPPVATAVRRTEEGLYVEARLSDLSKDSDADGLPDVLERRLFTDPHDKDTDKDGTVDGQDPSPLSARPRGEDRLALLRGAMIERLHQHRGQRPIVIPPGAPFTGVGHGVLGEKSDVGVSFWVGEVDGGHEPETSTRMITLSEAELREAEKKLGHFYPAKLEVHLNHDQTQAQIEWDEGWRGGTYAGRWTNGRWELEELRSWIS